MKKPKLTCAQLDERLTPASARLDGGGERKFLRRAVARAHQRGRSQARPAGARAVRGMASSGKDVPSCFARSGKLPLAGSRSALPRLGWKHSEPRAVFVVLALVVSGCETQECVELRALKATYEKAIAQTKARAALKKHTADRLAKFETGAKETMSKLGLDLPETKLKEVLDERAAKIPGATIERTTKQVAEPDDSGGAIHETLWKISFPAKSDSEAFAAVRALGLEPPLFAMVGIYKDPKGKWTLELMRASVVEVPMDIKPTEMPPLPKASDVKSELGFCGAGGLRDELAALEQEWLKSKVDAEELTVVMPKMATYEGLQRRAELLGATERENRMLFNAFFDAVEKAKLKFKATGVERAVVIYEIFGGASERQRLEKQLPEEVLRGMKQLESADKKVIRLSVVNRVADEQIKHRSSAMRPGVGLAPEK
jgi:hypothetical protein